MVVVRAFDPTNIGIRANEEFTLMQSDLSPPAFVH